MHVVTIDTGTTNTRVFAWKDRNVIAQSGRPVGVRDTAITKSTEKLAAGVKEAIDEVLQKAQISSTKDVLFLASGMITSNVGLCEIPHLVAPVGIHDFANGLQKHLLQDVVDQPIWFVPGVKNHQNEVTPENCETMDIMRGEEAEAIGIMYALDLKGPMIVILPGSHSKFVKIDEEQRIEGCMTTISGELLDVITKNTILASSLDHGFAGEVDESALLQGAKESAEVGLARCCFSVRILEQFKGMTREALRSFLLGAVLQNDIFALKTSKALNTQNDNKVVIGGKATLKKAFDILLRNDPFFKGEILLAPELDVPLSGVGIIEIARTARAF